MTLESVHEAVRERYAAAAVSAAQGASCCGDPETVGAGLYSALELDALPDEAARLERLCELNAVEQAVNVCRTTIVRDAWARGQSLAVHAWIYGIRDGLLRDLGFSVSEPEEVALLHGGAVRPST